MNQWATRAGCTGILLLCAAAPVMWWEPRKHRLTTPQSSTGGRLAVLRHARQGRLGIINPPTNATVPAVCAFERLGS